MKNFSRKEFALISTVLIFVFLFFPRNSFSGEKQTGDWTRVQSDNGEFSVEVPANYVYFFDKDGFSITFANNDYRMKNMSLLNSVYQRTLLSFEVYEADKKSLQGDLEDSRAKGDYSEIESNGTKIKQIIIKTENFYSVKRYFSSKKFTYLLTAASESGETPAMKRFFDSLIFEPNAKTPSTSNGVVFSKLNAAQVNVTAAQTPAKQTVENEKSVKKDESNLKKLIIISKPRASYTDAARMNQVKGKIAVRAEFSADGFVHKMEILKSLPEGLLRQAVFSVLRIKFLPEEENSKAISVKKTIEYQFTIY